MRARSDVGDHLERRIRDLEEELRRKDDFIATLGHELRNPLAPILTALEMMNARGEPSSERERQIIERQVRHIVQLVDDVHDLTRIAQGRLLIHKELVEIAAPIARAAEMTAPLFHDRRHDLGVRIPTSSLLVEGDPRRLAQVFSNLLENAAKYTEPGGRVDIVGFRDADWVSVSIRDSGKGIAPDVLPHVFNRFVQSEHLRAREAGGLGLGLSIVRTIVQMHDGVVTAISDGLGMGSTFTVRLPVIAH